MNSKTKKVVLSGMFVAIGLFLPFITGEIPTIGKMLLPMHIPVLLCGLIVGWKYGLAVGIVLPILRSFLFGMPPLYPVAIAMAFEMGTYGFVSGFFYSRSKFQCTKSLYRCIIVAMLAGRLVWAGSEFVLLGIDGNIFTWKMFVSGAFFNAIPGIVLQLILIPTVMIALHRTKLIPFYKNSCKK